MEIIRSGSQPSVIGSAEHFTGKVRIDSPFKGLGDANVSEKVSMSEKVSGTI